jgi:hypothetical protein
MPSQNGSRRWPLTELVDRARSLATQTRARRELTLFLVLLAAGLFVLPVIIGTGGFLVRGPYASGGPFALLANFFVGLAHGSLVFWGVALGPYLLTLLLRLFWYGIRASRGAD